jgi:hypothetical protein
MAVILWFVDDGSIAIDFIARRDYTPIILVAVVGVLRAVLGLEFPDAQQPSFEAIRAHTTQQRN